MARRERALMLAVFTVTFPFCALVLCGYLAMRYRLLQLAAIPGLSTFVLCFALSAMLFDFGAATPLAQLLNFPLMFLYAPCSVVIVAAMVAASRNERIGIKDPAFERSPYSPTALRRLRYLP